MSSATISPGMVTAGRLVLALSVLAIPALGYPAPESADIQLAGVSRPQPKSRSNGTVQKRPRQRPGKVYLSGQGIVSGSGRVIEPATGPAASGSRVYRTVGNGIVSASGKTLGGYGLVTSGVSNLVGAR